MLNPAEAKEALTGPFPSISTPFKQDGEIDYKALEKMLDFLVSAGSKTIMLTAGDSHYICMSEKEIADITKAVTEYVAGRAMVIVADRCYNTKEAVEFAQYARDVKADMLMVMPPDWAQSSTPETLAEHYKAIAVYMPVMIVTNIFIQRGMDFGLRTIELSLDKSDNIVAIKDDFCGEFARKMSFLAYDRCAIVAGGQKQNHMNNHPCGCDGYLSTFMKFKPEIAWRYWKAIEKNDLKEASSVIKQYDMPFFDFISSFPGGFDAGLHGTFELFGLADRWRKPPYYSLNNQEIEKLAQFFKQKSLL